MSTFRRLGEHPPSADAFDLAARLAPQGGRSLAQYLSSENAAEALKRVLREAPSPLRIHGRRVEEMFAYVVATLGAAKAVKREDAGTLVVREDVSVAVPDFRVILQDGVEILVEVKNCHRAGLEKQVRLSDTYLAQLRAYGELFGRPVYVAAYWSQWRQWTLHPVSELQEAASRSVPLTLMNAVATSHMRAVGDVSLATVYPLKLRFVVDAERVAATATESTHRMVIREVQMFARGKQIHESVEKDIAWSFMLNGRWSEEGPTPVMEGTDLRAIEFTCQPEDREKNPDFAIVAAASTLASVQFNSLTTLDGEITRLHVRDIAEQPFPKAKDLYASAVLPIWRLIMQPQSLADWSKRTRGLTRR